MSRQRASGRPFVLAVIFALLGLSLYSIGTFISVFGTVKLPQQIVRFLFSIALCICLYRGANWARWVTALLCLVTGAAFLVSIAVLQVRGSDAFQMIAMGTIYLASAGVLLIVPSVRAYFGKAYRC